MHTEILIGKAAFIITIVILVLIYNARKTSKINAIKNKKIEEEAKSAIEQIINKERPSVSSLDLYKGAVDKTNFQIMERIEINNNTYTNFLFQNKGIKYTITFSEDGYKVETIDLKSELLKAKKAKEIALNNTPLKNYFAAIEDSRADTIFYYLKLNNGNYKIGITVNSVESRYSGKKGYQVLYEERLINARQVEKAIINEFSQYVVNQDNILGTEGTEIFNRDILKLDYNSTNQYSYTDEFDEKIKQIEKDIEEEQTYQTSEYPTEQIKKPKAMDDILAGYAKESEERQSKLKKGQHSNQHNGTNFIKKYANSRDKTT